MRITNRESLVDPLSLFQAYEIMLETFCLLGKSLVVSEWADLIIILLVGQKKHSKIGFLSQDMPGFIFCIGVSICWGSMYVVSMVGAGR